METQNDKGETGHHIDRLVIGIAWIGHQLKPIKLAYHDEVADHIGIVCPPNGSDGSEYIQNYCVTKSGEIINILEYATQIA